MDPRAMEELFLTHRAAEAARDFDGILATFAPGAGLQLNELRAAAAARRG